MSLQGASPQVSVAIVLYKQTPDESTAFRSLRDLLDQRPAIANRWSCLLFDNSPEPSEVPPTRFRCVYAHDPSNPGLALAYQTALDRAHAEGTEWLLLLDQDTAVTSAYLDEVLTWLGEESTAERSRVGVLAPKLLQDGDVLSPHWLLYGRDRGSFLALGGLLRREVAVFNSGAVLRVRAVVGIGGFPQHFPLDYLDHAVFRQLQRKGWAVWLLQSTLEHHLASKHGNFEAQFSTSTRLHSILRAQSRFYRQHGNVRERTRHLLDRARRILGLLLKRQTQEARMLLRYTFHP